MIFLQGNQSKDKRSSADHSRVTIFEDVAAKNWYEQALVSETRIKAFFGATLTAQRKLIDDATRLEAEIEVRDTAATPAVPPAAPLTPLVAVIRQETLPLPLQNAEQHSNELCHTDQREREIANEPVCDMEELENLMEIECLNNIRQTHAENANLTSDM